MGRQVLSLDRKAALNEARTGGKGAGLARLRQAGFRVPPGFVITTLAFQDFLAEHGLEILSSVEDKSKAELEQIAELVRIRPFSPKLERAITRAYRSLGGPVAVRSSFVGEDSTLASFAGQLDTELSVQDEDELLQAVKRCWASVFNWRLARYISERESLASVLTAGSSMALVVQRMVRAKAAGVAFSADPVTGQRCAVIEAVPGLGEALVQGQASPDRYVVDARGVLARLDTVDSDSPVLTKGQVLALAEIVHDLACTSRHPLDVEWAWDGDSFHLLQCRPVASLVGKKVYSNRMVSDMSPGLVKPLVYSTKVVSMAVNVFGRVFTELIGPNDFDFARLTTLIHSRIYTDLTLLGDLFERVGMPANFFEMISRDERSRFQRPPLTAKTIGALVRVLRFAWRHSRPADQIDAFLQRSDAFLERYRRSKWTTRDPKDLIRQFDELMHVYRETQWFVFIGPMNMAVRNRLLGRFVSRRADGVVPADLIRGLVGLKALEPNAELRAIARHSRALEPADQRLLVEGGQHSISAALSDSDLGRELLGRVDVFLDRYGFLSTNGTDFTGIPWCENPAVIWHSIGRLAAAPVQSQTENVRQIRETAREQVRKQLNPIQRRYFDWLLASTIRYIDLRERTSLLMSEETFEMRRIFLALAGHLVAQGDLGQRDDVFYLTCAELRQVVARELSALETRRLIAERRAEMEADAQVELPDTICGEYVLAQTALESDTQDYLVGIGGSSGIARGQARVVHDPAEAPINLRPRDILVVPFTDVGWTPLFSGIGGIVAETGGQLSHTSIVAREYGLPAVVSARGAMRLIAEGQTITVDGNRGRVYLEQTPEPEGG